MVQPNQKIGEVECLVVRTSSQPMSASACRETVELSVSVPSLPFPRWLTPVQAECLALLLQEAARQARLLAARQEVRHG